MDLLILFAFLAGLATVVSPCVLPVLPLLLSTTSAGGRLRPLGVVLGLVVSFTVATLITSAAVQALALPTAWLRTFAIVAIGLFGLSMLIPALGRGMERLLAPLSRVTNTTNSTGRNGFGGGIIMGAGLGLLWAPCVGPIMAAVIALAVTTGVSVETATITLAYAMGAGIPMLAIGYGTRKLVAASKAVRPHSEAIRQAFGALTVLACLALFFGLETRLQTLLPAQWSASLTGFEQQAIVQKEISNLQSDQSQAASLPPAPEAIKVQSPKSQVQGVGGQGSGVGGPIQNPGLSLPDMGPAPELTGLTEWINSKPLTLQALRGNVVIVDFWTFACYNCQNTQPYVRALYDKYKDKGLEILGIHAPEFAYERVPDNVRAAAKDQGVTWPIALDPDFKTWNAYNNRYWPAFYFIDTKGHLRYTHFGEGNYDYNEKVVQQLLSEAE